MCALTHVSTLTHACVQLTLTIPKSLGRTHVCALTHVSALLNQTLNLLRPVEPNIKPVVGNNNCVVDEGAHTNEGGHANEGGHFIKEGAHTGAPLQMDDTNWGAHVGPPLRQRTQLSTVVQWFKTMSTNEYIRGVNELGWPPFDRKLWQRNYYEHIIRDDVSLLNIAYYIENNPAHWQEDDFYQPQK